MRRYHSPPPVTSAALPSKTPAMPCELDIGPGHSAERPVVRRLTSPDRIHDAYWDFANGIIGDVAGDLLGPDVTFNHAKLNFK